jgi:DNA-binding Lrp family transcriptional regulator
MPKTELDGLDFNLIDMLSRDARVSNRKIASDLGVTEGTVRGRIKRLQNEGLIAFTAISGLEMASKVRLVMIDIQVSINDISAIARKIAELPFINAVLITMGKFNILAICLLENLDDLVGDASDMIQNIEGVHHVETTIALKTLKYNTKTVKITKPAHV